VLAASSLTEAFTTIGRQFEAAHPGDVVRFSFGPSDGLAAQIQAGAPADVFASASETWMDAVQRSAPGVVDRSDFARNRLVIIVPPDDPAKIESLADLGNDGVKLVLAAEGVPAGDYAREALRAAGVGATAEANVVSNEQDDKAVVQKVLLGEADAGIVYRTDLTADVASQVKAISIPEQQNVIATYAIAAVAGRPSIATARAFVDYVTGPAGQRTLRAFDFLPP
jgi:molybdate transport system substrate-binding protein